MKTYVFKASLGKEEDVRWNSLIEDLPGCAAWGASEAESLHALKDAAEVNIEDMLQAGDEDSQDL